MNGKYLPIPPVRTPEGLVYAFGTEDGDIRQVLLSHDGRASWVLHPPGPEQSPYLGFVIVGVVIAALFPPVIAVVLVVILLGLNALGGVRGRT